MHKRIVKAIQLALSQTGRDDLLKFYVQSKETDGFWGLIIMPAKGYEHLIPHIEAIGMSIGRFYGEGLWCEKGTNHINFS